jgi:pyruvate/2-oxoglutarate dehydrogenase complex dihydrolipoamide acyltransferase (E2) component
MAEQTFRLPDLGEGLTEAQLVAWRVKEGDQVDVNAPLADVETAKAVVVIPSPYAGMVQKLHAKPGETVAVGAALVTIEAEAGPHPSPPPEGGGKLMRQQPWLVMAQDRVRSRRSAVGLAWRRRQPPRQLTSGQRPSSDNWPGSAAWTSRH